VLGETAGQIVGRWNRVSTVLSARTGLAALSAGATLPALAGQAPPTGVGALDVAPDQQPLGA
jgi:hypothetical protein